jgi:hypothetical protein
MSANPVEVDKHTMTSSIQARSTTDNHDVRRTEITKDRVVGVKSE